jgi:lipopolysaccharide biosynthesis regulator YciM
MRDTLLLAVALAAVAGVLAGRAWAAASRRGEGRPGFRSSPHYIQGLHYLAAGQLELAISELTKVTREHADAVEVLQVLGNLLREAGQVERAIKVHQGLFARADLTRAERIHALACLGMDFWKAGFLDRSTRSFNEVLEADPKNIHALIGLQKLYEEQQQWREAYDTQTRLSRLRKTDERVVLGYLQAAMGQAAARGGQVEAAEKAFLTALSLDRRVFPASLALADLRAPSDPAGAAAILEDAIRLAPERAYLAFDRLESVYAALGEPSRLMNLCERMIQQDPRDWRARLALARCLEKEFKHEEAFGLLLKAVESNPQVFVLHLETWRVLRALGSPAEAVQRYVTTVEQATVYADPHLCTACRYRADGMLWRCPHCHEWGTFVEERVAAPGARS